VKLLRSSLAWLLPVTLLLAWWQVTSRGWVPAQLLVAPRLVVDAARELIATGELAEHARRSLSRLATGFATGAGLGLLFGVATGTSRALDAYLGGMFQVIRQVPTFAFVPVLILILGVEETFKVVLVAKAAFFPVAIAAFDAVRGIPAAYLEVAAATRMPLLTRLRRLIWPATFPPILVGVRISLGRSWMVLVAAELIAAESGIGQMMEMGRQMFRMDVVMVGVFITGLVGLALDRVLRATELRLTPWRTQP
jgi:sulfonate transport system permease protein